MMNFRPNGQSSIFNMPDFAAPQPTAPQEAFTWAQGGRRLTPEMQALEQRSLLARQQGDYSPVQHWTQGLARVADQLSAGFEQKQLDKDIAAQQASQTAQIAALIAPKDGSLPSSPTADIAAAITSSDPMVQKLGMARYERENPKSTVNDTERDYAFWKQQLTPEQFDMWIANKVNPPHFAMLPNGQMGMVGGYQPPATAAPDVLPPNFDFGGQ